MDVGKILWNTENLPCCYCYFNSAKIGQYNLKIKTYHFYLWTNLIVLINTIKTDFYCEFVDNSQF
jgi:hypothetical protein